jgi:hypothetical protein
MKCALVGTPRVFSVRMKASPRPKYIKLWAVDSFDNVLVEASEAAIYNVLPGQMGYSSTLSDRRDVTRVDCRVEDVAYLVPLTDAERFALTCV